MGFKKPAVVDKDLGWKEILHRAQALSGGAYVKVGILGGSDDRGGLHHKDADGKASPLTIGEIAVVNEFGTEDGHIPARSFVRSTFDRMRAELQADAFKLLLKIVLDRKMTVEDALNILGLKLATGIKKTITEGAGVAPPNAPSTAKAKVPASSKGAKRQKAIDGARPLVDTGAMLAALSWAVVLGTVTKASKFLTRR
jgi:hypothetical protein